MATSDVTVLGGGIFGLSIAYSCLRRGARVRLVEQRAIGSGSSGGLVGALAPHVPGDWNDKKQFQFESLLLARDWWREIEQISEMPSGYARTGRVQPLADARAVELAQARVAEAQLCWKGFADWRVVPLDGFANWAPETATGLGVLDTLSARLSPIRATKALTQAIRRLGGEIIVGEAEVDGAVVWATGWSGLRELSSMLGRAVGNGVKGQSLSVAMDARDGPQLFVDGLHIVPHDDGTVAVGSTSERSFDEPTSTDEKLDALWLRATKAVPALAGAPIVARWAGVRPRAATRAPMLGRWPGRPGHYVANGGFKIGFGIAPKVGETMAALVLDGTETMPAAFRLEASLEI